MDNRRFSGSIALSKLVYAKSKSKKGATILIIPVDANHITEKDGAFYLNVSVVTKLEPDQYKQHGFISQTVDSATYKAASDAEKEVFKKLPILGNIKDFSQQSANNNTGEIQGATGKEVYEETDDLPF